MQKPIEFKAGTLTGMTIILRELDNVKLSDAMHAMLGGKGEFFSGELAIIDLTQLTHFPDKVDWAGLNSLLRRYGLQPVALKGLPESLHEGAKKSHFSLIHTEDSAPKKTVEPAEEVPAAEEKPRIFIPTEPPLIITRTIRSGQQIYAKNADLILMGNVSYGAEIIADGNIHCYGSLRGRALVGASNNPHARLFCTNFGAELVSISGVYRTFEKGIDEAVAGKPATAMLKAANKEGDPNSYTLSIEPLLIN